MWEQVKRDNGNIPSGNFPRVNFPRGSLMSGNITGGNFPGGNFPRTVSCKMITNRIYSNFCKKSFYVFCLSRVFFYWRFLFCFTSTEKWNKKRNTLMELKYRFVWRQSCKFSKEIWQMVIWLEKVFKENLMLQFSWLEEFC